MKRYVTIVLITCALALLAGCHSLGGYHPVVDTARSSNYPSYPQGAQPGYQSNGYSTQGQYYQNSQGLTQDQMNRDYAECETLANQAHSVVTDTAIGAGTGALIGAAGGAIIGAFTGNPGKGAAIGAAAGGFGAGAQQGYSSDQGFKQAYDNCMAQRGYRVIR